MAINYVKCLQQNGDIKNPEKINDMINRWAENDGYSKGVDPNVILKELAKSPNGLLGMAKRMELQLTHDDEMIGEILKDMKELLVMKDKEKRLGITTSQAEHINATNILTSLFEGDKLQVRSKSNVESIKKDFQGIVLKKIGFRLGNKYLRSFSDEHSQDIARALFKDKAATSDAVEFVGNVKAGVREALELLIGDKPEKRAAIEQEINHAFDNLQFDNRVEVLKLKEDEYVETMKKYLKPGTDEKVRAKYQHFYNDLNGGVDYSITEDMAKRHTLNIDDFKSINAYVKYLTEFNQLTSVVAAIQEKVIEVGYKVGLYKKLGSNPQRTLNKIFSHIYENREMSNIVSRSGGGGTGVNEAEVRGMMDILLGRDISPNAIINMSNANGLKEKTSMGFRKGVNNLVRFNRKVLTKLKYTSDLGLSPLTQAMGDGQVLALGRAINNLPNNGTFKHHLRMIANLDGETRRELLEMATPLDYYMSRHAGISAREGDNVFASRNIDIFTSRVNYWNGFEKTGLGVFDAAALQANMDIAMNAGKQWDQLSPEYQSFFLRNSWTPEKWNEMVNLDVRRKGKFSEMVIDDTKLSVELRDLYRATVINSAQYHSGRPTLHLRNLRYRLGGPIGTGRRELVDMFMYLQSFAITQAMNHLGNIIFNGGAGVKNINYQNVAFFIGIGVALHYTRFLITHALVHGEVLDITQFGEDTKEGQTLKNGLFSAISYGTGTGVAANWLIDPYTFYGADVKNDVVSGFGTPQSQTAGYVLPTTFLTDGNLYNDSFELLWGDNATDEDKISRRRAWRGLTDFIGGYTPRSIYTTGALRLMADTELNRMAKEGITGWQDAAISAIH